jgi:hypothetical protein
MTSTFFGPCAIRPWARTWSICCLTLASQPVGWVVTQMKPRTRGLMIMKTSLDVMPGKPANLPQQGPQAAHTRHMHMSIDDLII